MGIIRRPWLSRASGGNLATGVTPLLFYEKCHGIFNDHRESGPRFNISSERRCFFDSIVSPSLYRGVRTHTDHRMSTPCWFSTSNHPGTDQAQPCSASPVSWAAGWYGCDYKWATAAEDYTACHSCQLRTGNGGYNLHRLTKIGE